MIKFCRVINNETKLSYIGIYLYEDKYSITLCFPEKNMGGFTKYIKDFSKNSDIEYEIFEIALGFEIGIQENS